jgi:hypothetical protein
MFTNHSVSERVCLLSEYETVRWVLGRLTIFHNWVAMCSDVPGDNRDQILAREACERVLRWPSLFGHEGLYSDRQLLILEDGGSRSLGTVRFSK